jgi:hypothetical protein
MLLSFDEGGAFSSRRNDLSLLRSWEQFQSAKCCFAEVRKPQLKAIRGELGRHRQERDLAKGHGLHSVGRTQGQKRTQVRDQVTESHALGQASERVLMGQHDDWLLVRLEL